MDVKVGMINWDAGLPEDTFFGRWAMNSLGCEKWKSRLPYYAVKDGDGWRFPERTQRDYDRELQFAIDAGIDYFAYCWYTEEALEPELSGGNRYEAIRPYIHELNRARHLFESSPMNDRIDLCAIILGMHGYSAADWEKLALAMTKPYYHKIDGRPLAFIFGGYCVDHIQNVRAAARSVGLEAYVCILGNEPDGKDCSLADAASTYADGSDGESGYAAFAKNVMKNNEARKEYGLQLIPEFSTGWNPTPRFERPTPWAAYPDRVYVEDNDGGGFEAAARDLKVWMEENGRYVKSGHVLSFAWNEFEEGGYVCPTLGADGKPDGTRLEHYKRAVEILKGTAQ